MFYLNIYFYYIAMLLVNFGFGTFLYFILLLAAGQYYHFVLNTSPILLHLISLFYISFTHIFAPTLVFSNPKQCTRNGKNCKYLYFAAFRFNDILGFIAELLGVHARMMLPYICLTWLAI